MSLLSFFNRDYIAGVLSAIPGFANISPSGLKEIESKGLTHDHLLIDGQPWILRIPRKNQMNLSAEEYLKQQQKFYDIASLSGHAPDCLTTLAPQTGLPQGALIIRKIQGRKPILPDDWTAIATALAALHHLPVHDFTDALQIADRPFASQDFLLNDLFKPSYDQSLLEAKTRTLINAELSGINYFIQKNASEPKALAVLGGDSHPANFMIDDNGKAWLVDLEFMLGDMPHIDLADAALPITSSLEPDIRPCYDVTARSAFYKKWQDCAAPSQRQNFSANMGMAERIVRMRTLMWLCDWTSKTQDDRCVIPAITVANWDAMANAYLDPANLKSLFEKNVYPQLIGTAKILPDPPIFQPV